MMVLWWWLLFYFVWPLPPLFPLYTGCKFWYYDNFCFDFVMMILLMTMMMMMMMMTMMMMILMMMILMRMMMMMMMMTILCWPGQKTASKIDSGLWAWWLKRTRWRASLSILAFAWWWWSSSSSLYKYRHKYKYAMTMAMARLFRKLNSDGFWLLRNEDLTPHSKVMPVCIFCSGVPMGGWRRPSRWEIP